MEITTLEQIKNVCVGLDIYKAKNRISRLYPDFENRVEIEFVESEYRRFIVIDCEYRNEEEKLILKVTSKNPIKYLPSIYQENDFLRKFLMIFQHIMNETSITLDNLDNLFRPMEIALKFLPMIATWFGVNYELLGNEETARKVLQYTIPLYRYRGTKLGLKLLLYLITGVEPEILEGELPFDALSISEDVEVSSIIVEKDSSNSLFSVYFPVYATEFEDSLIKRIYRIIQNEKPVDTQGYLYFKKKKEKTRKRTVISDDMQIMGIDGFVI